MDTNLKDNQICIICKMEGNESCICRTAYKPKIKGCGKTEFDRIEHDEWFECGKEDWTGQIWYCEECENKIKPRNTHTSKEVALESGIGTLSETSPSNNSEETESVNLQEGEGLITNLGENSTKWDKEGEGFVLKDKLPAMHYHCREVIKEFLRRLNIRKAWKIGNIITFKKPNYKSPFFNTEEIFVVENPYKLSGFPEEDLKDE